MVEGGIEKAVCFFSGVDAASDEQLCEDRSRRRWRGRALSPLEDRVRERASAFARPLTTWWPNWWRYRQTSERWATV